MISSSKILVTIRGSTNRISKKVNPNIMQYIRGRKMKEINYWQQFLNTGKVDDYLSYLSHKRTEEPKEEGVHPDAGTGACYRDHFEGGTFRGI